MIEALRQLFRARARKRLRSERPTGLLPLGQIRRATVIIDAEDSGFDESTRAVLAFFRRHGIKGQLIYLDLRKIGRQELLTTSITHTVLRRDLNWYGLPDRKKLALLGEPDLLLSLTPRDDFPVECLVAHCPARFKAGRRQLAGKLFDLVVSDSGDSPAGGSATFQQISRFLEQIQ